MGQNEAKSQEQRVKEYLAAMEKMNQAEERNWLLIPTIPIMPQDKK